MDARPAKRILIHLGGVCAPSRRWGYRASWEWETDPSSYGGPQVTIRVRPTGGVDREKDEDGFTHSFRCISKFSSFAGPSKRTFFFFFSFVLMQSRTRAVCSRDVRVLVLLQPGAKWIGDLLSGRFALASRWPFVNTYTCTYIYIIDETLLVRL